MLDTYDALLTGVADGESDFIYALKSYSGIHYSGLTSYLTFQLPRQENDIEALIFRPNGEILLRENGIEIYRGAVDYVDFFNGPASSSFTISASYSTTEVSPITSALPVEEVTDEYDGKRKFKIAGYHSFKPTDSILYNSETIEIDQVMIVINSNRKYMKLREL